jgi:isopentenyl-diphosphate Delta-isomerase
LDIAKAIALGADLSAFGQPLLAAALESPDKVIEFILAIIQEIKIAMLCVGARNLDALKKTPLVHRA